MEKKYYDKLEMRDGELVGKEGRETCRDDLTIVILTLNEGRSREIIVYSYLYVDG